MGFVSDRGRTSALGSLDHDIRSQRRENREVTYSRGTMNPGWEIDVSRAAEVGTDRIIGARWKELWLHESRSMTGAGGETAGKVPYPIMASHHITRRHAETGMGTLDAHHGVARRAEPIVLVH